MDQDTLEGMPEPGVLRLHRSDGQVLVTCGRLVLYRYDAGDAGMRNLAVVALTDAGRRVDEVADGPLTEDNQFYAGLSPRSFFDRITEPVLIEHGTDDSTCPIDWSRRTHAMMRDARVDARLVERPGEEHAYGRLWSAAMGETYAFLREQLRL